MEQHLQRAQVLVSQNRFDLAEQELGQLLAKDPQSAEGHLLMAVCLYHRNEYRQATTEAERAIQLDPSNPSCHLILANTLLIRDRYSEAEDAAEEALRLDPYDEDIYSVLARIAFVQSRWDEALEMADEGLALDPDHSTCQSMRSLALEKLGHGDVAVEDARQSLQRNPDDSDAHATLAWALLTEGKYKESQESFREALRLDPTNEFAKQGMIQALNANNFFFRMMLKWYTLMGRLSGSVQWIIILGLFFGQQFLSNLAQQYPSLAPYVFPITTAYLIFAISTWLVNPLFNTFLRFNRYGRYLLDKEQIYTSNTMGGMLAFGVLIAIGFLFLTGNLFVSLSIGLGYAVFMLLPIAALYNCEQGPPFIIMLLITITLGLIGIAAMAGLLIGLPEQLVLGLVLTFIYGNVAAQFAGIALSRWKLPK